MKEPELTERTIRLHLVARHEALLNAFVAAVERGILYHESRTRDAVMPSGMHVSITFEVNTTTPPAPRDVP